MSGLSSGFLWCVCCVATSQCNNKMMETAEKDDLTMQQPGNKLFVKDRDGDGVVVGSTVITGC